MTAGDGERSFRWAGALLDGLARSGVRRIVASPGSRSTPLTLAALRHPGLQTHVVLDERSAGFFGLGLAKAEKRPVVLIATSGSAIANWAPAVVEADMAKIPLILLSADRPPELQDCGANQTMDQIGLFGRHVRAFHALPPPEEDASWLENFAARIVAQSLFPVSGPVHVNTPLREPLTPREPAPPAGAGGPEILRGRAGLDARQIQHVASLLRGRGIILCGPEDLGAEFRAEVVVLARRLKIPIVADILSGLRFDGRDDPPVLGLSRLDRARGAALRLGAAFWPRAGRQGGQRLAARPFRGGCRSSLRRTGALATPTGSPRICSPPTPPACAAASRPLPPRTIGSTALLARDRAARRNAETICAAGPLFEGALLRALFGSLPDCATFFLANSLAIRSAEWFCGAGAQKRICFGNRGLSGIDGNLSTASGTRRRARAGRRRAGRSRLAARCQRAAARPRASADDCSSWTMAAAASSITFHRARCLNSSVAGERRKVSTAALWRGPSD